MVKNRKTKMTENLGLRSLRSWSGPGLSGNYNGGKVTESRR